MSAEEASQHLSLCATFANPQRYEAKEAESIKDYIVHDGARGPLVVYGGPGCGKTALVASCAKKVHFWLPDSAPFLIVRFVPVIGEAVTLQRLLSCLCQQVADVYQAPHLSHPADTEDLRECFADALSVSTEERPLVLILDAVDRLRSDGNLQDFQWLPSPIPRFTKVILSVTQDCDLVKSLSPRRVSFLQIKPSRKECNESLKSALAQRNRKITSGQQLFVNRSLGSDPSPLQVLMLFKEVIEWKSHQEVDDRSLGGDTYQIIERFFRKLEVKYGYAVLSRAVSYITLSRSGVGEAELIDLMSADDEVLAQLYRLHANVGTLRVPDWLVASILLDLKSCLSWRTVTGFRLLCWTNELYQKVTYSRYLSSPEVVHTLHVNMCHYFSGRWACGRSKPISVDNKQNEGSDLNAAATGTPAKIYADCQLPSQPWFFTRHSRNQTIEAGNVRKAYELPFHLKECVKLDNLFNDIVLAVPYHKVLIQAGLLHLLFQSMEEAAGSIGREEVYVISDLFKEIGCVLIENPDSMEFVLQSKMAPLVHTYPALLKFVKQTYCEGTKRPLSLNVLCSPLSQAVLAKVRFQETSRVVSVLEMQSKPSLIVVFENGGIWTWGLPNNLTFRYQLPGDAPLERAIAELNGRHLALVTKNHMFAILDCSSWTLVCAIKNMKHGKTQEIELTPKNIHLVSTSLFVCYENSSTVRIYNVRSGAVIDETIFPQVVTFFGCESSARYTILGQTNKILIYDNKGFDLQFDLNVDLLMLPISDVYIQDHLVYIIDKASNIMVWDTEDPTEPRLVDEIYTDEVNNEMMSSEITTRWLLIGRSKTIDVWDVLTWEKISFEPPGGSRFLCCVLSESGEEIIAAVEGGSSIFVWGRESGQCLSVIRQGHGEFTLFAKCPQLGSLIAATANRYLLRWDLKSVVSTTCLSQTGRSVESLLLCPQGIAAFTADGSEIVCKWDIPRNKIRTCFLHNDLVAMMALTATGELLVTSVASGDLFVWVVESGENVQYIRCGPVSRMLVTPNAGVMVCMCEDGLTRVWNPATGNIVCNIRVCLHQAAITPGGTFLIGLDDDKLLAVSLWSGSVCKQLRWDTDPSGSIDAFRCMESHPDFVVVLTSGAELYTWDVVEDTVCHQVRLPIDLSHPRKLLQVSSNGGVVVVTVDKTVNVFNAQDGKLGVFFVPNPILHQRLTDDGKYFLYTCHVKPDGCNCDFHANPVLNVINVRNGEKLGRFPLGKMPSAMMVSEDGRAVCIGFEDGTIGLYSLVDAGEGRTRMEGLFSSFTNKGVRRNVPVGIRLHKQSPDVIWSSCTPETYNSDSG
ncbi:NACHT and WD repeat domain-containing protein 2-like [Spea bombifrons]|uniref:NACHT and WD repeat domain-containing protein 2-like n=1 Tax=Spea bombifrons TaxID=233779 RepID=UPI00234B8220|nr:NACHT and WD repeat domain-containing protein 2-like [Spea bombifrons]